MSRCMTFAPRSDRARDSTLGSCCATGSKTLWASVLAHGFNNTIGFIEFFFVGAIPGCGDSEGRSDGDVRWGDAEWRE